MKYNTIKSSLFAFTLILLLLSLVQSVYNPLSVWNELLYHFEIFDIRGLMKGSIFAFTYLLAVGAFFIILALKSSRIFLFFMVLIFILFSIDLFVQFLGVSHGFSYDEYSLSMNEMGNYKYLAAYVDTILKAMGLALLLVLSLYFIRLKVLKLRLLSKSLLLAIVPMIVIYLGCLRIDTFKLSSYPSAIKIPNIAVSYMQFSVPIKKRILNTDIKPTEPPKFKNIIWIIDESVTGTYLSINGYEKETTPFLKKLAQQSNDFVNFGIVNSVSNCSSTSNLLLRIGLNPYKHDVNESFSLPTIYQYAKRAGYRTWLFDSQTRKDHLQNYLTVYDKDSIDNFRTFGADVTRIKRDEVALTNMLKVVNKSTPTEKNFIVLVKYGSHFPYLLTYDQQFTEFTPVLESSYGGMRFEQREEMINTYLNSIYFTVDLYLKKMLDKIDLSESIVFYTSDHGQDILEKKGLTRTHCNSGDNIVKNEVSVPFFLFTKDAKSQFPKAKEHFYSQIQIFPTTLSLLGYSDEIVAGYGKTLLESFSKSNERKYIPSSLKEVKVYK